jgi:hypothetical protein
MLNFFKEEYNLEMNFQNLTISTGITIKVELKDKKGIHSESN